MSTPEASSSSAFLGVGWSFPVTLDADGRVAQAAYDESVAQAIWLILATSPGERPMRPDFGCGLEDLVFAPATTATYGAIETAVSSALLTFEPRVEVLGVSAAPSAADPSRLEIWIDYRVRATNNRFNVVYPFYLEQPAA